MTIKEETGQILISKFDELLEILKPKKKVTKKSKNKAQIKKQLLKHGL